MRLSIKYFLNSLKKYKLSFIICLAWIILLSIMTVVMPFIFKLFLDFIIKNNNKTYFIAVFIGCFILYYCMLTSVKILWYRSLDVYGGKYISDLVVDCEKHIANSECYQKILIEKNNTIRHTLFSDTLNIFISIGHHMPSIISSFIIVIIMVIWSAFINYLLAIILFGAFALGIIISYISKHFISKASKDTNKALKDFNKITNEFVDSIELIKMNDLNTYMSDKTKKTIKNFIHVAKKEDSKTYFWTGISDGYNQLITYLISCLLVLPFFGESIVNYAFYTIICSIVLTESQIIENNLRLVIKSNICFKNIDKYLSFKVIMKNDLDNIDNIEIKNLSFAYDERYVINNLSFNVKSGDIVLLKGTNGSGKSTLAKCIAGLYNPSSGDILYDNKSYKDFSILNSCLYIDQNEIFLNESVRDYIYIITGKRLTTEQENRYINQLSLNDDFFDTIIINYGENLSNGERKKLQIIRIDLLVEEKNLFILDEITSGLDVNTYDYYVNLLNSMNDKIIILIEHNELDGLLIKKVLNLNNQILQGGI